MPFSPSFIIFLFSSSGTQKESQVAARIVFTYKSQKNGGEPTHPFFPSLEWSCFGCEERRREEVWLLNSRKRGGSHSLPPLPPKLRPPFFQAVFSFVPRKKKINCPSTKGNGGRTFCQLSIVRRRLNSTA